MKIDLIDESVDLSANPNAKDYIGTVRIPLRDLITSTAPEVEIADCFPVRDEAGLEKGRMEVKISYKDYSPYNAALVDGRTGGGGDSFIISKFAERDIIGKIAEKFAGTLMESIDMIFDMLIEPGSMDASRISKQRFKSYILDITDNIRGQDVDILLKTHSLIAGKDYIELNDFRQIFEGPVSQAKLKKVEEMAEREKSYMHASKFLRQSSMNQDGFSGFAAAAGTMGGGHQEVPSHAMTFTKNPFE